MNSLAPPNSICFLSSVSFLSLTFGIQVPNVQQIQYCSHVSICKHSFNPQSPILNLVKIISSLRFPPVIFPVPTFCCILYKCLPFSTLSQLLCHFFHNFNPDFSFSICFTYWDWYINILLACFAKTIYHLISFTPICAGIHVHFTFTPNREIIV